MAIGSNYPSPVVVNGYLCRNCSDVDQANKFIDPAHPAAGPFGINAAADPTLSSTTSFTLGGNLAKTASAKGASGPSASDAQTLFSGYGASGAATAPDGSAGAASGSAAQLTGGRLNISV